MPEIDIGIRFVVDTYHKDTTVWHQQRHNTPNIQIYALRHTNQIYAPCTVHHPRQIPDVRMGRQFFGTRDEQLIGSEGGCTRKWGSKVSPYGANYIYMYPFATYTMCTKCTNICTPSKANTRCKNWLPIFGTRYEQLIGSEEGLHQKMGIQVFTIWRKLFIYVYICCILYIYESDCTADGTMGPSMHQMVHLGLFRGMRP